MQLRYVDCQLMTCTYTLLHKERINICLYVSRREKKNGREEEKKKNGREEEKESLVLFTEICNVS